MLAYIVAAIKEQREKQDREKEEHRVHNQDASGKEAHPKLAA